jgi:hypothetical protein
MNKVIFGGLVLILACSGVASGSVTLTFDPNDLIQLSPADSNDSKTTQPDARRFHMTWATDYYGTFNDYLEAGHSQPSDYNAYMNWRNSLGAGEGIAMFNSWFLDDSIVRSWGETIVIKPGTTVAGTAADGWNVRVIDSPYGLGGSSVQWWTTDSSKYINTVSNIGNFSITADLYWDNNGNGWDPSDPVVLAGDLVRFWAGNLNGDDPEFYRTDTQALYFNGANYSTASGDQGSGFEAVLTSTATIPEPAAIIIWTLLGWLGIAFARRHRKRAI